jgi:hypothetical protein
MVKLFLLVVLVNYLAGPGILRLQVNSCGDVEVWRGKWRSRLLYFSLKTDLLDHIT